MPGRKGADSVKEKRRVVCLITDLGVAAAPPKQPIFNIYSYNLIYTSFGTSKMIQMALKAGLNYNVWGVFWNRGWSPTMPRLKLFEAAGEQNSGAERLAELSRARKEVQLETGNIQCLWVFLPLKQWYEMF